MEETGVPAENNGHKSLTNVMSYIVPYSWNYHIKSPTQVTGKLKEKVISSTYLDIGAKQTHTSNGESHRSKLRSYTTILSIPLR